MKSIQLSAEGTVGLLVGLLAWIGEINWATRAILVVVCWFLVTHIAWQIGGSFASRLFFACAGIALVGLLTWHPIIEGIRTTFAHMETASNSQIAKSLAPLPQVPDRPSEGTDKAPKPTPPPAAGRAQDPKTRFTPPNIPSNDITRASPDFLKGMLKDKYGDKRSEMIAQFKGKWMRISGIVGSNNDHDASRGYGVTLEGDRIFSDFIHYDDDKREYVVGLTTGQRITAFCQIDDIAEIYISLIHCQPED